MTPTLYAAISANPYLTQSELRENPTYPPGATIIAIENIKDIWQNDISEYATGNIYQNAAKKMIIKAVTEDCLEKKRLREIISQGFGIRSHATFDKVIRQGIQISQTALKSNSQRTNT